MAEKPPLDSFLQKSLIQRADLEEADKPEGEVEIKYLRGKKGDKGDSGKNGEKGATGERGLPGFDGEDGKEGPVGPKGEVGERGERGFIGEKGDPGTNGLDGKDGVGKDGSPDTPKQVIEKINKSKGDKIKRSRVEGLDEVESIARTSQKQVQNFVSLGGSRQTAIKVSGTLLGTGINTINFVGATGTKIGDGSEVNVITSGSGTGQVNSIVAGSGIAVDSTDPANPIVSATGSGSGITRTISSVSTTTAAAAAASTDYVYLCTGTFTITLPTAISNKNLYTIKNVGSGTITVATTSAQTIDGSTTAPILVQYTSLDIISDNSNWNIV